MAQRQSATLNRHVTLPGTPVLGLAAAALTVVVLLVAGATMWARGSHTRAGFVERRGAGFALDGPRSASWA